MDKNLLIKERISDFKQNLPDKQISLYLTEEGVDIFKRQYLDDLMQPGGFFDGFDTTIDVTITIQGFKKSQQKEIAISAQLVDDFSKGIIRSFKGHFDLKFTNSFSIGDIIASEEPNTPHLVVTTEPTLDPQTKNGYGYIHRVEIASPEYNSYLAKLLTNGTVFTKIDDCFI